MKPPNKGHLRITYKSSCTNLSVIKRFHCSAKVDTRKEFLQFVDLNFQPNGQRLESRNPTHYLLPYFKSISTPKRNALNYEEKKRASLVCEFNCVQTKEGKETISDFSASSWLKQDRPKVAIYPHQSDYCDFCSKVKKELQGHQQRLTA